jgi:hypothetical protein
VIEQVGGDPAANGMFKIGNVSRLTFDLFDAATGTAPVAPSGAYTSGGRWAYPLHPYIDTGAVLTKVFYRVTGDDALGTFLGTFVSVNGVDRNKTTGEKFRVWQLGRQDVGRLLLDADLTDANGNPLPAGTYTFTFFGVAETGVTPPLSPPPDQPNAAYLMRLRDRLDDAQKINDAEKQARVLDRLRAWTKIVSRGIDPDSREGRLKHRLVNARALSDPILRTRRVDRLLRELEKLKE